LASKIPTCNPPLQVFLLKFCEHSLCLPYLFYAAFVSHLHWSNYSEGKWWWTDTPPCSVLRYSYEGRGKFREKQTMAQLLSLCTPGSCTGKKSNREIKPWGMLLIFCNVSPETSLNIRLNFYFSLTWLKINIFLYTTSMLSLFQVSVCYIFQSCSRNKKICLVSWVQYRNFFLHSFICR
jgi:hypothetical protein